MSRDFSLRGLRGGDILGILCRVDGHEMSVSGPFEVEGRSFVEVRFASAHDYEVFEAEVLKQKILPEWTNRLHRGFARLVLDITVRELEKSSD